MHDIELLSSFFDKSIEYYSTRYERYKNGDKYVFNVFAFLFGIFWFMYRKMYVEALIIFAIVMVESFIEGLFTANLSEGVAKTISLTITFALGSLTGVIANGLYFRKAERTIEKAMLEETDHDKLIATVQRKGGVSYWFIVVVVVALVIGIWYFYNRNNE